MDKKTIYEIKKLVNNAYDKSTDCKISLYLKVMDILDYYSGTLTTTKAIQFEKEYNIKN